jgi:hypothetical protein
MFSAFEIDYREINNRYNLVKYARITVQPFKADIIFKEIII